MPRNIENYNQVTSVTPDISREMVEKTVADVGQELIKRSQQAKIQKNLSDANLELNNFTRDFQIAHESDPTNEKGMEQYQAGRQNILNKYGDGISPLFRGDYDTATEKVKETDDQSLQAWQFKQLHTNSVNFLNDSIKNDFTLGNTDGRSFASGGITDIDAFTNFHTKRQSLMDYGAKNLGEQTTHTLLENYDRDYMKSFVMGVAETDPAKAAKFMDEEKVKAVLTPAEASEMTNVIHTTAARHNLAKSFGQTQGGSTVTNIINDKDRSYFDKRLEIDKMEYSGQISTKIATQSRRVLESQKNVDSVTSTPVMSDIVNRMYDLNAMQGVNNEDYLKGVENIREEILKRQASGEIHSQDVQNLNNRLTSLTAAKVSQATVAVGSNFYEANKKFDALPPEYRGQATRQLFHQTEGQENVSDGQYNIMANKIVDDINNQRRAKTVKLTATATMPDSDFLKTTINPTTKSPYTMEDVNETAKIHNMTAAQVIYKLREKRMKE